MRLLLYLAIFLLSVVGNVLVIALLARNKRLRTVTNSFLLSLAVSDLMVAVFCIPFTLIPNLMQTFVFGKVVCKAVAYLMGERAGGGAGREPSRSRASEASGEARTLPSTALGGWLRERPIRVGGGLVPWWLNDGGPPPASLPPLSWERPGDVRVGYGEGKI